MPSNPLARFALSGQRRGGFTLIEILVATAIFTFMAGMLLSLSSQATTLWSRNHQQSQLREKARTALDFIGSEMKQAVLPLDLTSQSGPQFVVNPAGVSATYQLKDAVFWQAPIATSQTHGNLAIVGYFIRRDGARYRLCRYFINPNDGDYRLRSAPADWVNDNLIQSVAPADEASDYKGLFLENVVGLWVECFDESGAAYVPDSRADKRLPVRVKVSLAVLDERGASRVADGEVLPSVVDSANAGEFLDQVSDSLRPLMDAVQINVTFDNRPQG
jgi:prepilin-type N-terminal cleavage/methylation domain-containing protein